MLPRRPPTPRSTSPARRPRAQTGRFIPEKCNIWRDCVDGHYDWVKEHIAEARSRTAPHRLTRAGPHDDERDHRDEC